MSSFVNFVVKRRWRTDPAVLCWPLLALMCGAGFLAAYPVGAKVDGVVVIRVRPATTAVAVGDRFEVSVEVDAGAQDVDGAAAYLNFDPGRIEALEIRGGSALAEPLFTNIDNAAGRADYVAGTFSMFPTGQFELVKVVFRSKAPGMTSLGFNTGAPRVTDATFAGASLLGGVEDGVAVVVAAPGCSGDCDGDGAVLVDELVQAVSIVLGQASPGTCSALDRNADRTASIDELVRAMRTAGPDCASQ